MLNIQVLGAGVMSSAFAHNQANYHNVHIFPTEYDHSVIKSIESKGKDVRFSVSWPSRLVVSSERLIDPDLLVIGVSSAGIDWALSEVARYSKSVPVLLLTKGIVIIAEDLIPIASYVASQIPNPVSAISGPCIAQDLANGGRSYVALAGEMSESVCQMIQNDCYDVSIVKDMESACWLGALKNCYALAIAAFSSSENARAYWVTCALKEMQTFLSDRSGEASMVTELSGIGDLMVTLAGGRNGQFGGYLQQGMKPNDILNGPMKGKTVEGLMLIKLLAKQDVAQQYPMLDKLWILLSS
ncbi:hypothetical protein MMH89_02925 [Candidatus Comchoanobacter bicostacola]|uniref:Glycerol-3-phosphate dehydrogenase n=1 Tax=Candidatus Comchoanobacter bicostacola TaxID=2919598 RepID=A0ABY5DK36_9GAMM|nr:hypothetical protein [Candidatus Comchoanobacter bicostacola]UTC24175.1 hypothetical protein MMH89_02925 [Candidatus Comchoanobacter bicostacola]